MNETMRPVFDAYTLPLPRRREGPAAALSFVAHVAIAVLVLWRGAALFESGGGGGTGPRGGGGGGGRPAVSWFALPAPSRPQAHDVPAAPEIAVPTLTVPLPDAVKIDVPPPRAPIGDGRGDATRARGRRRGHDGGTGAGAGHGRR